MLNEHAHERYFSPVSRPNDFGQLELVLKFETAGVISNFFKSMKPGMFIIESNNRNHKIQK